MAPKLNIKFPKDFCSDFIIVVVGKGRKAKILGRVKGNVQGTNQHSQAAALAK